MDEEIDDPTAQELRRLARDSDEVWAYVNALDGYLQVTKASLLDRLRGKARGVRAFVCNSGPRSVAFPTGTDPVIHRTPRGAA